MNKLYNNRFIFIVSVSLVFIMALAFGSIALTKSNSLEFSSAGYIISSNEVLSFDDGTTYRINLNENVVFKDQNGEIYEVSQDSFIHYQDGSIGLLKNGAFVDLDEISNTIVPYYNITSKSLIEYTDGGYTIQNGSDTLYFDDILLRVSDTKYLIAGKNLSIKVPGVDGLISGQYFEITYIEEGIVLIENDEVSYQVTSDGTLIYVGSNTIIDLGTQNVLYDGEAVLAMSEVTIDGNENITIYPQGEEESIESTTSGDGSGDGDGTGSGSGSGTDSDEEEDNTIEVEDNEVSIDLVSLTVDVKEVTAILQVNNPLKITGTLVVEIVNTSTGDVITPSYNITSTGYLSVYTDSLSPNTSYMLSIYETDGDTEKVYLQRFFTTTSFDVTLKKVMITESEINYTVIFGENSEVSEAGIALYDENGDKVDGSDITVTSDNTEISFVNLDSNSTYTIRAYSFKIGSVTYVNESGFVTKTVKTLKQDPSYYGVAVNAQEDGETFTLSLTGIEDPDSAITSYTFYIYEEGDLNNSVYSFKSNVSAAQVKMGENNLSFNTNYRFKVLIEYNDNEKVREIETAYSALFVTTGATVTFEQDTSNTTFNTISGNIILTDPDCTVPMPGRTACDAQNSFTVSYYVGGVQYYKDVTFVSTGNDNEFIAEGFTITGLSANTTYTMQLNGNLYVTSEGVTTLAYQTLIGNSFTATTDETPTLQITKKSDNTSTDEYPINVTVSLTSNSSNASFIEQVKTMKVTLYALDASNNKIQIGDIVYLTSSEIMSLLYNKDYQITNKFFGIEDIEELSSLATSSSGWIYSNYEIDFEDAYDVELSEVTESSNKIEIEDNEVTTSLSSYYMLSYYASDRDENKATVTTILNKNLSEQISDLDGSTTVGYTIDATIYISDILREYYGVTGSSSVINWNYVYYIFDKDMNIVYTSEYTKDTSMTFYLDDDITGYERGNAYSFGFQIVLSDGIYPDDYIIAEDISGNTVFNPAKESPQISMGTWSSTEDSITFVYKVDKDVDDALYNNYLYLYESNDTSYTNIISSVQISKSDDYQYVTFTGLNNSTTYKIVYRKINNALSDGYSLTSKGAFIFDGYYDLTGDFTLQYSESGNQLGIIINDDTLVNRTDLYEVTVSGGQTYSSFLFTSADLDNCDGSATNCLVIDYGNLEEFQGMNTTVSVKAYYENGLIGLNQTGDYYVFKDDSNKNYLVIKSSGKVSASQSYSQGIYKYERNELTSLTAYNLFDADTYSWSSGTSYEFSLSISGLSVGFSNYGGYNPKVVEEEILTSADANFYFSNIVPMVKTNSESEINEVTLNMNLSGITKSIAQNEFESSNQKIYVDLYDSDQFSSVLATESVTLDLDNLSDTLTVSFDGLVPDNTYYYKIYAYILNDSGNYVKTELYDYNASGTYEIRTKSVSTLGKDDIFDSVDAAYYSKSGTTYMTRYMDITVALSDIDNYKLYYIVKDSSDATVYEETITSLTSSITNTYDISSDTYVFGDAGYTITIKAITDDANAYELELYSGDFIPHLESDTSVTELRSPTLTVANLSTFVTTGSTSYSASFKISVADPDLVIKNALYYVRVYDINGTNYTPTGYVLDADGYITLDLTKEIGTTLTYTGLDPASYYFIVIKTDTYRNNASLGDKDETVYGYGYIETGNNYNLSLGTGTLSVDSNILTIDYTGASNLNNITKVSATIMKDSSLVGTYTYTDSSLNFTYSDAWKLTLDATSSAISLSSDDNVRVIVSYYAKDITTNVESLVSTVTYANY